jgi:multidrug resistance efflux pump
MSVSDLTLPLPARRADLVFRPLGDRGEHVVKDPRTGAYFKLGAEAYFLLSRLDGVQTAADVRAAYAGRFGEPLAEEDLGAFLQLARSRGLLQTGAGAGTLPPARPRQSLLAWRCRLFDPDRLFSFLAPRLWFVWTRGFLVLSAVGVVAAAVVVGLNREELAGSVAGALRWETALWVWLTLVVVTTCHEFAHGLTCKHYGGEVHEVGFLMLLLLPCFYCNVSDAWLFKEKSKRLAVTLAGGVSDLCLWAVAVFAWRLTLPGGLPHHLAWVVVSVCGGRVLCNLNPLLKLDGYYLLSDWVEIPNLRRSAWGYVKGWLRCLLWGAARPGRVPRGRFLLAYGTASLLGSAVFLILMLLTVSRLLGTRWGPAGLAAAALLAAGTFRALGRGLLLGEVRQMILRRHVRTGVWVCLLGAVPAALALVSIEDRSGGPFQVRPQTRAELRAPVAGFLRAVQGDEGDRVSSGAVVALLEVPDLASRLAQKRAEVREAQARLHLLEAGPRYEEVAEQRQRVERAREWRDLAEQDLRRGRQVLREDLARLDKQLVQYRAELEYARSVLDRSQRLRADRAVAEEEVRGADKQCRVARARGEQAEAEKRARQALGTQQAEAELARRGKELADAQSALTLLEAGTRPEEVEAEGARLARLEEEARYLEGLDGKLRVCSPVAGVITTARLREKIGQYVREGDLICQVDEPAVLEAEIAVPEQEAARVQSGQPVELKARALPFETLTARVERLAPAAAHGEVQSTVTVYCRLDASEALRPGMTGHARIGVGRRPAGAILFDRGLRLVRTEFWW